MQYILTVVMILLASFTQDKLSDVILESRVLIVAKSEIEDMQVLSKVLSANDCN